MLVKTKLQIQKISFICKVIENILDNLVIHEIYENNDVQNIKNVIQKEFDKNNILTVKNFVVDGMLVDEICHISQGNQVVHGNGRSKKIEKGILKIDLVGFKDGVYGDAARSYIVGESTEEMKKVLDTSKKAFLDVLNLVKTGDYFYKISKVIHKQISKNDLFTSDILGGHGIGEKLHENISIPNHFDDTIKNNYSFLIQENTVLAIEPIVFLKKPNLFLEENNTEIHVPILDKNIHNIISHYENTIYFDKEGAKLISDL